MYDRKQSSLPKDQRQYLFDKKLWTLEIDEDDVHFSHRNLELNAKHIFSATKIHQPYEKLKDLITKYRSFYIHQPIDRKNWPEWYHTSKEYSKKVKQIFDEEKKRDPDSVLEGWWICQSWEAHTTARNHMLLAAGPLIDLKPFLNVLVVNHAIRPHLSTNVGDTKSGNVQQRPLVSLHVSTNHPVKDPVEFFDRYPGGPNVQWALDMIAVGKAIQEARMTIRFDVHRDILSQYYKDRMLQDMASNKAPTPVSEKLLTNVCAFRKFINRTFSPCQEDISLNSTAATFPLGGGVIRKDPHDSCLRFEWSLPHTKGKALLQVILSHQ